MHDKCIFKITSEYYQLKNISKFQGNKINYCTESCNCE